MILEDKLKELEKTQKEFWNIDRYSAILLSILIKSACYKNIVEVGASNGYSGLWLANAAKETGGKVITVEFHKCRFDVAKANFEECGLSDFIDIKQEMAIDMLNDLTKDDYNSSEECFLDFAFVDANKAQYIKYYEIIDKKLRKGGMICFDNMISHKEKVVDLYEAITNNPDYQTVMFPSVAGMLIALKVN